MPMAPLMPPARLSQKPLGDRVGAALLDLWCFGYVTLPFTSASLMLVTINTWDCGYPTIPLEVLNNSQALLSRRRDANCHTTIWVSGIIDTGENLE